MKFQDVEQLSAFLDGQLSPSEAAHIESRLAVDASLRKVLDDLRVAHGLLRRVPHLRAPRSFTLSPTNARVHAPRPRSVPLLRSAGALASLFFAFTVALNTVVPMARQSLAAAPAYGFGMGGAGGGGPAESLPAESGPADFGEAAEPAPTMETLMAAPPAPAQEAPLEDAFAKSAPPAEAPAADLQPGTPAPVPTLWIMVLAVVGAILIGLSVYIDRTTRRKFRSRVLEK